MPRLVCQLALTSATVHENLQDGESESLIPVGWQFNFIKKLKQSVYVSVLMIQLKCRDSTGLNSSINNIRLLHFLINFNWLQVRIELSLDPSPDWGPPFTDA